MSSASKALSVEGLALRGKLSDLMVGCGDLLAQLLMPAGKATQRGLRSLLGVAKLLSGTQPGTDRDDLRRRQVAQLLPQLVR